MTYPIPRPRRTLDIEMPDGAHILARVHGNADGPRLMLSHGNGFAINAYAAFWSRLTAAYEVVVYDQRNHGSNPFFGSPGHSIDGFARDLDHLLREIPAQLGEKPTAGLYHSVSALAAMTHAVTRAENRDFAWDALVLFDPPLVPSPGHEWHEMAHGEEIALASWAMGRPNQFADPQELADNFAKARGLRRWVEGAHLAMARAVLREDPESGGLTLACPRELEAAIYIGNAYSTLWRMLPRLSDDSDRVLLICSDPDFEGARAPSFAGRAAAESFGLQRVAIPQTRHLLQIEAPEACADAVLTFFNELGFGGAN